MSRWMEIFEVNGVLAIRNATVGLTILVASGVIIYITVMNRLTTELFATYLLAGGGVYSFGKWRDSKETIAETEQDKPPATVISDNTKVETVSGDINVKSKEKKK